MAWTLTEKMRLRQSSDDDRSLKSEDENGKKQLEAMTKRMETSN